MIGENHLIAAIDHFSKHSGAFSLRDFTEWTGEGAANPECYDSLKNGPGFIQLEESHLDDETVFISELALFRWWFSLNAQMSLPHVSRTILTRSELAGHMNLLAGKKRAWGEFNDRAVEYGERFGFVFNNSSSSLYAFPLAHLFSYVNRQSDSIIDDLYEEMNTTEGRDNLLRGSFREMLAVLNPREEEIIRLRFGIECENPLTLEEISKRFDLTRERIRQIEKVAMDKIRPASVLGIFLADFIRRSGRLLIDANSTSAIYARFANMLTGIPYEPLLEKKILFLGLEKVIEPRKFLSCLADSPDTLTGVIRSEFAFLSEDEINRLESLIRQQILRKALNGERIYIALKRIGKPAHYTDITAMHNELFPEKEMSYKGVHVICSDSRGEELGIVWVGMKGIYALKEWGYRKPETDLFETVRIIVNRLYEETGKPVSHNSILAEIGKYRKAVNPKSVAMAMSLNKKLERLPNNFVVPRNEKENSADDMSEEEIGERIASFRREQQ